MDEQSVKRLLEMVAAEEVPSSVDLWPTISEQLQRSPQKAARSWLRTVRPTFERAIRLTLSGLALAAAVVIFAIWTSALRNNSMQSEETQSGAIAGRTGTEDQVLVTGTVGEPVPLGAVTVTVTDIIRAETETVVGFHIVDQSGGPVHQLNLPRLHLEGELTEGVFLDGTPTSATVVATYPPLPAGTPVVTFTVGPVLARVSEPITVVLDVDAIQSGGQQVTVGGRQVWVHRIEANGEGGFRLLIDPLGSGFQLIGPGVWDVTIHDESGQAYTYAGLSAQYDPGVSGTIRAYEIDVQEPLAADSSRLTISVAASGQVMEPVTFRLSLPQEERLERGTIEYPLVYPLTLPLDNYPPRDTPYLIEDGDFWLVHSPEGNLLAFVPVSPEYREDVSVEACRFTWVGAVGRFVDPCSGDEWELDGTLNLANSTERWSNGDLDQYALTVNGGEALLVYLDQVITNTARGD